MQLHLSLDPDPLLMRIRDRLRVMVGPVPAFRRLDPISQLVRSILGSRTYDAVSETVFAELRARFRPWTALARAREDEVLPLIAPVTFAKDKAPRLIAALDKVLQQTGSMRLDFLESWALDEAMDWLQGLPGVGQKVAASILNFSTMSRRVFVVDGHVLRVAQRLAICGLDDGADACREAVMEAAPDDWEAEDFTDLHVLMKRLGQGICVFGSPDCRACALDPLCPRSVSAGDGQFFTRHSWEVDSKNKIATANSLIHTDLRRRISRLEGRKVSSEAVKGAAVSLGPQIDAAFVDGMLPPGLHQSAGAHTEDAAAALILPLAAILGLPAHRLQGTGRLLVVQELDALREGGGLFGPGMEALGLPAAETAFVRVEAGREALRVADEAMRNRAAPVVLIELRRGEGLADLSVTRRFNLAARRAGMFVFLATSNLTGTSAAATRWRIASAPSRGLRRRLGPPAFHLDLVRNRQGLTGRWLIEWSAHERRFLSTRPFAFVDGSPDQPAIRAPVGLAALHRQGAA